MSEGTKVDLSTAIVAFVGGVAAGAVAALLLTPRTGTENRAKLEEAAEKTRELAGRIPAALEEATQTIRSAIERARGRDAAASVPPVPGVAAAPAPEAAKVSA